MASLARTVLRAVLESGELEQLPDLRRLSGAPVGFHGVGVAQLVQRREAASAPLVRLACSEPSLPGTYV